MRAKPIFSYTLVASALALPAPAYALALGKLTVDSALGQPLSARIELASATREELDSITAKVADPALYRQNNLSYQGVLTRTRISVERGPDGRPILRVTSPTAVNEPFLDLMVEVNWASGLDAKGRPIQTPQPAGQPTFPGNQGGTNWYSPSYSPRTGLFYLSAWENYTTVFGGVPAEYQSGMAYGGGTLREYQPIPNAPGLPGMGRRPPINSWTETAGNGAVIAIDPATGRSRWRFPMSDVSDAGILTTATDLLFTGGREGYFQALDARTGKLLWKTNLGSQIMNGPISYRIDGKQYVAVISGLSLCVFSLRD